MLITEIQWKPHRSAVSVREDIGAEGPPALHWGKEQSQNECSSDHVPTAPGGSNSPPWGKGEGHATSGSIEHLRISVFARR